MRPLSRRELIDSSKASLATLFDTAASRMPSHGAPLPSLSSVAMISRTLNSVSSGSLGASSFAAGLGDTPPSPRTPDTLYTGIRYRISNDQHSVVSDIA